MSASAQAYDVSLPAQGTVRVVDFDSNGFVADPDAIITNIASSTSPQTLTGASLNGVIGAGEITPPRNMQLVLSNHADWDATTAVVTGTNYAGAVVTENLAIPDGGNATVSGVVLFKTITSLFIPAQSGATGTGTLGVGTICSLEEFAHDNDAATPSRPGAYLTMEGVGADFLIVAGAAGATVATPDATARTGNARTVQYTAATHYPFRAHAGRTDAIKCKSTGAAGRLIWFRSSN